MDYPIQGTESHPSNNACGWPAHRLASWNWIIWYVNPLPSSPTVACMVVCVALRHADKQRASLTDDVVRWHSHVVEEHLK